MKEGEQRKRNEMTRGIKITALCRKSEPLERKSTALYCKMCLVLGTFLPRKTLNRVKINKAVNVQVK